MAQWPGHRVDDMSAQANDPEEKPGCFASSPCFMQELDLESLEFKLPPDMPIGDDDRRWRTERSNSRRTIIENASGL